MQFVISIVICAAAGAILAHPRVKRAGRIAGYVCIWLLSNVWLSMPYFTDDPKKWHLTYFSGLQQMIFVTPLLHILPAFIACLIVRKMRARAATKQAGH